jgi:FlaA1/EpsC-like NDP-sugar epimerase
MIGPDPVIATGRSESLFAADWAARGAEIDALVRGASVLILGGAGTIGSACIDQLLEFAPRRLHVIDTDENGLARLARDLRAAGTNLSATDLFFLAADFGAYPAEAHLEITRFDLVLNFAAVKHVRSEKSVPAILHMIATNVVKQDRFLRALEAGKQASRCFVVSTDKAADPANFMGASKRLLEEVLFAAGDRRHELTTSSARFANVAFSSGSLLESFVLRLERGQPLAAPRDTRRFFLSAREAAEICLLSLAACPKGRVFVPRLDPGRHLVDLAEVASAFLDRAGYTPAFVETTAEAGELLARRPGPGEPYPLILTPRDTTGEKPFEIFVGQRERMSPSNLATLAALETVRAPANVLGEVISDLSSRVAGQKPTASAVELAVSIGRVVPNFVHAGGGAHLDDRV